MNSTRPPDSHPAHRCPGHGQPCADYRECNRIEGCVRDFPKAIELGHVVVNVHTGVAARVRGFSPQFGPFDDEATVLVEIGRLPWGHQEEWLRSAVVLSSEWERRKSASWLPEVEMAGIRTERRRRRDGLIRLIPRLGPWCRVDRRLRTAPHGDALDTTVRSIWDRAAWDFETWTEAVLARGDFGTFTIHPHQQRFLGLFSKVSWDANAVGRLTPGALKLAGARIMARPGGDVAQAMADQIDFEWESRRWAEPPGDAEAAANGMGC